MAPASLLDSDDFERLPSQAPPARPARNRRTAQIMSDGSTFMPSPIAESSHATITRSDRRDLRADLNAIGPIIPRPVVGTSALRNMTLPIPRAQEQDGIPGQDAERDYDLDSDLLSQAVGAALDRDQAEDNGTGLSEVDNETSSDEGANEPESIDDENNEPESIDDEDEEPEPIDGNPFQLSQSDISRLEDESSTAPEASIPISTGLGHNVTQALNPLQTKTRDQLMQTYQEAKDEGNFPFVDFVYNIELACTTLQGADRDWTMHEAYEVYISFPEEIITGLINGTLPRLYNQAGSEERRIQEQLRDRAIAADHPAYYMVTITDRSGEPPELTDVSSALRWFEMYIDGNFGMCSTIDETRGRNIDATRAGRRWYLDDEYGRLVPRRLQACQTFARNLRAEIDRLNLVDSYMRPFPHYFVYFGITGRLLARFEQHEDGRSSNYILQLFRACLAEAIRYKDDPEKYKLSKYVVGLCGQPQHAALGEILVTRLGQGYVTSGTGFAHYPAGRGINISLSTRQWTAHWQWMYDHLPSERNHQISIAQKKAKKPRLIVLSRSVPVERMMLDIAEWMREKHGEFMEGRLVETE